jgi:TIR domain
MASDVARSTPPDGFVSYSHQDREWVLKLVARLRHGRKDGRPLTIAMDDDLFVPGESLIRQIERSVRTSSQLVCVLSPDYLESDWGRLEAEMKTIDDPSGRKGLLIPILHRNCDVPYFLRLRLAADFRQEQRYEHSLRRLAWALGATLPGEASAVHQPAALGFAPLAVPFSSDPEPVTERLCLNLFEASTFPEHMWAGETSCTAAAEVLAACGGPPLGGEFVLRGDKLYSFEHLGEREVKLSSAVSGKVEKLSWDKVYPDPDLTHIHVELLNRVIGGRYRDLGMMFDRRYQRYYFPLRVGNSRYVEWPGLKKKSRRRMARSVTRANGEIIRVEHAAVHARFARIGGRYFLQVLPTRSVTTDGFTPMRGGTVGKIVGKLTRRTFNDAFWMDVMFWLSVLLVPGPFKDSSGNVRLVISSVPMGADLGYGVMGDHKGLFSGEHPERWAEFAREADEAEFASDDEADDERDDDTLEERESE